jgi:DNA-binding SARP family transcriptional activator
LATRIHLCGSITVTIDGERVEGALTGRQGRLLFAYLVLHRLRASSRDELIDAVWPEEPPDAVESALSALVSKLRKAVGAGRIEGRSDLRLVLPEDAWVDVEAAAAAVHRAEAAVAREDWSDAWVAARIAQHIAVRPFLLGDSTPWIEERRRELEGTHLRALELAAQASLGIGGGELDTAERTARSLVRLAPFSESGYRYLMRALELRDNRAEALQVYDDLRQRLRNELGISPSPATQDVYRRLLG